MATTINSYSVSLGMDARGYVDGAALSRRETNALVRDIEAARTPAEKYENALDRLTTAKAKGAIQTSTFIRLMDEEKRKLDSATISANANAGGMDQITGKVKALASAYLGMQTVTKSIRLAIDAEQAAAQFEVLTGSMNDAKLLGQQIRDFAAISPVSLSGAQNAAKTMLAFNIQVQDVHRNLQMLGDISGGNQQRFDSLTLAFSQMSAAGRLMGQDLLQFVAAGFNPLQEISRKTGESMIDLKARMEAGAISTQEVTDAFISATSEGGKFDGMTEKMAETMGGKLAIASANLELALTKLGTALGPLVITLTEGMDRGVSVIDKLNVAIGTMADGLAFVVALGQDLSAGGGQLADILGYGDGDSLKNVNALLDLLEKRDADAASGKLTPFDSAAIIERTQQEINAAADGRIQREKQELEMIDRIQREINSASNERIRKEEQKRMDMETRLAKQALRNADEYFAKERGNALKLLEEIAKGPGGGIMADSNEAAKFMADQVNKALANDAVTVPGKPTDEQLLEEARRQYEQALIDSKKTDDQIKLLEKLVEKTQTVSRAR